MHRKRADMGQDFRYALRYLTTRPGVLLAAALSIALGVGANTAIFTFTNAFLMAPLPVRNPHELVVLQTPNPAHWGVTHGWSGVAFSYPMYADIRDSNTVFSGVACRNALVLSLTHNGQAERVVGDLVSGNFFDVMGVSPSLGQLFSFSDDTQAGAHPVVVLSHGYWVRRFGADPAIVGRGIRLNGREMTVVGVTGRDFEGIDVGQPRDVFIPLSMATTFVPPPDRMPLRERNWLQIIARRKSDVTPEQAQAAMNVLHKQLLAKDWTFSEQPSAEEMKKRFFDQTLKLVNASGGFGHFREIAEKPLLILTVVVAIVLLIACANVANLLLAQAAGRRRDIAVSLALGATRWRLVRQMLVESALLSVLGSAVGVLLAFWMADGLAHMLPTGTTVPGGTTPNARVLWFTLGVAVATGILFGIAPALQATGSAISPDLRGERSTADITRSRWSLGSALVVAQVSLSLLLTVGAALFLQTLHNLRSVDLGFRTGKILLASLNPNLSGITGGRSHALYSELVDRVRALPQVRSAAIGKVPLLTGTSWRGPVNVEGYRPTTPYGASTNINYVTEGFFDTLGIDLVRGRLFSASDVKVAVLNETAAKHFFGDENPLGRRLAFGRLKAPDTEIVGVVKDTMYSDVREGVERIVYFTNRSQEDPREMILHIRTDGDPNTVAGNVRTLLRSINPDVPLYNVRSFETQIDDALMSERLLGALTGLFGAVAAILAALGVYGVFSNRVARRTREIGIRMALGAGRSNIARSVLTDTARLTGSGIVIGLGCVWGLTRFVSTMLYGVKPTDSWTLGLAVAGMITIALVASLLPARRASRVDPMQAIRTQ